MKTFKSFLVLVSISMLLISSFSSLAMASVDLSGFIEMDERARTSGTSDELRWNRAIFGLKAKSQISLNVAAYAELHLKSLGLSSPSTADELADTASVQPVDVELREAYIDVYGFIFDNVDLKAGKQRIAWGTADRLNPTDVINPYDFTDILKLGEKAPTNSLKLASYFGDTTLTGVFVPTFTPAIMPDFYLAMYTNPLYNMEKGAAKQGINLTMDVKEKFEYPPNDLSNSMFGAKVERNFFGIDFSLSYFNGYDSIPNMTDIDVIIDAPNLQNIDVSIEALQTYPKIEVVGFDLAGDFYGIGFWAEVAHVRPENAYQQLYLDHIQGTTITGTQEVADYTKFTVGFDYKFLNGLYINTQFMHGFFDERSTDLFGFAKRMMKEELGDVGEALGVMFGTGMSISDMLFISADQKFFNEKFKIEVAAGWDLALDQEKNIKGHILKPSISYYPADATEITLGFLALDGDDWTKFGMMRDQDQAYLQFKYSF